FFQAEDGIRDFHVTGVQTCALPIFHGPRAAVLPAVCGSAVDHDRVAAVGHRLETHAVFERNRCFHLASPDGLPADRAAGGGCIIPRKTGAPALLPGPSPA